MTLTTTQKAFAQRLAASLPTRSATLLEAQARVARLVYADLALALAMHALYTDREVLALRLEGFARDPSPTSLTSPMRRDALAEALDAALPPVPTLPSARSLFLSAWGDACATSPGALRGAVERLHVLTDLVTASIPWPTASSAGSR